MAHSRSVARAERPNGWEAILGIAMENCRSVPERRQSVALERSHITWYDVAASPPTASISCFRMFAALGSRSLTMKTKWRILGAIMPTAASHTPMARILASALPSSEKALRKRLEFMDWRWRGTI